MYSGTLEVGLYTFSKFVNNRTMYIRVDSINWTICLAVYILVVHILLTVSFEYKKSQMNPLTLLLIGSSTRTHIWSAVAPH